MIPADLKIRLDRRFKRLSAFLKDCGVTSEYPTQSMRAECGCKILLDTKYITEAQRVLGHSSPTVTAKHYANILKLQTVGESKPKDPLAEAAKLLKMDLETLKKKLA